MMRTALFSLLLTAPAWAQQPAADAPTRLATLLQADVNGFDVTGLSRTDLMKLRFQLQEARPGIAKPAVMMGVGGALALLGLTGVGGASVGWGIRGGVFTSYPLKADPLAADPGPQPSGLAYATWVTGAVLLVAGAALLVYGALKLSAALPLRRLVDFKLDLVEDALVRPETGREQAPVEPAT